MDAPASGLLSLWKAAAFAVFFLPGCSSSEPAELDEAQLVELATLPGLRYAELASLREEFARLKEERAMPAQVRTTPVPDEINVAAVLVDLFPRKKLPKISTKAEELFPAPQFRADALALARMIRFRERYETERGQVAAALSRPECNFGIDHRRGFFGDTTFLNASLIVARLEAFYAAEQLSTDRTEEAAEAVSRMLKLAEHLAREKHVGSRITAARIRLEALSVTAAVFAHENSTAEIATSIYRNLLGQLERWPHDAMPWIGDRAIGMIAYEAVRAGHLMSLLSAEELERFAAEGILHEIGPRSARRADRDEMFYLQAMRRIIAGCCQDDDPNVIQPFLPAAKDFQPDSRPSGRETPTG